MINDIIDAISTVVTSATGLRCVGVSDNPPTPCALVYVGDNIGSDSYYRAMRGGVTDIPIIVEPVYASSSSLKTAARAINDHISPFGATSIPLAILNAPTLDLAPSVASPDVNYTVSVESVTDVGAVFDSTGTTIRFWRARIRVNVKVTRGSL